MCVCVCVCCFMLEQQYKHSRDRPLVISGNKDVGEREKECHRNKEVVNGQTENSLRARRGGGKDKEWQNDKKLR